MKENQFENVDISAAIGYITCPKEDTEIQTIKKACTASVDIFSKYLKDNIMDIIDSDRVRIAKNSYLVCGRVGQ